jgi:pilus assembly protein Flp/PilA
MGRYKSLSSIAIHQLRRFLVDDSAATAIEYGLVAAGVGGFIATTIWGLGTQIKTAFYDKLASLFP